VEVGSGKVQCGEFVVVWDGSAGARASGPSLYSSLVFVHWGPGPNRDV
jgi:hypothetical protein